MSEIKPDFYIMPAEHFGDAECKDGFLEIGGVKVPFDGFIDHNGKFDRVAPVYVRRYSDAHFTVAEIHIVRHDGLAMEAMAQEDREANEFPAGPKEYWRLRMVPRDLTNEQFEEMWESEEDAG